MRRRGSEPGCKRESGKTGGEYDASQLAVGRRERRQMDGDEKEGETSLERLAEVNLAYYQETEHTHVTQCRTTTPSQTPNTPNSDCFVDPLRRSQE